MRPMATTSASTVKPFRLASRELLDDPYPAYARLRATAPITLASAPLSGRMWLVSRYADVVAVLKDPRFVSKDRREADAAKKPRISWTPRLFRLLQDSMVLTDDPDHARLRGLVHLAFTPRRVELIAARVETVVAELLDAAARKGTFDLVADFALPLPLTVISEMMGIPERDRQRFHHWMAGFLEAPAGGVLALLRAVPNAFRFQHFFEALIRERRADPQDDMISALVAAEQAGQHLSEDELLSMIFLLLLAGHETTVNLIGNGMLALLENPAQYARLCADPGLSDKAVEELLRFTNPVEHGAPRFAREPMQLLGQPLARGDKVTALLSSANRDETVFERADELDITRDPNRHVAFGLGLHYCLGAPLARMEGQAAFRALAQRFPAMKLAVPRATLRWRHTAGVRGLKALPVAVK
jgi:cytochrome P450